MKHVLLIDDDPAIRSMLVDFLSQHAFRVTGLSDSQHLTRIMTNDPADVVIVDLNLGHEDGLQIVRTLTTSSDAPVMIISGDRLEEADKVVGLELGAVDYITKPFGIRELLARLRSCLRRTDEQPRRTSSDKSYAFAGWNLNVRLRRLLSPKGEEVKLTAGEFNLLCAFLKSPMQVLSREQLLSASRVHSEEVFDRSIDVLILRLRRKLEADPSRPRLIKTERGIGYTFDAEVAVNQAAGART